MAIHVIREARRCLQCATPTCRENGCPVKTNIPEMIKLFLEGNLNEAGALLFENNPMSVFCSLVCDHEGQCEGNCIQGRESDSPVQISSIEHYISDAYLDRLVATREPDKGQKVAVIGSGPAGLTVAVNLARQGYNVTVFERKDKIGGMLRYGIPEFRLPKKSLDRYEKILRALGVHIRPNTTIGGALRIDDLFDDAPAPAEKPAVESAPAAGASSSFEMNARAKQLLKRINDQRTALNRRLRNGETCFFGKSYARVDVPQRLGRDLIAVLPEAMRDAADGADLYNRMRAKGFVFLNAQLCADLIENRVDYTELVERRKKLKEEEDLQKMLNGRQGIMP